MKLTPGMRLMSLKTGRIAVVTNINSPHKIVIANLEGGVLRNRRVISTSRVHTSRTTSNGKRRKSGYVVMNLDSRLNDTSSEPELSELSEIQLAQWLAEVHSQQARLTEMLENAKEEMRSRNLKEGSNVFGEVVVEATFKTRFNPDLARKTLSEEEYSLICDLEPSRKKAQALFGEGSDRYKGLCSPIKTSLRVRPATPEDKEDVQVAPEEDIPFFDPLEENIAS